MFTFDRNITIFHNNVHRTGAMMAIKTSAPKRNSQAGPDFIPVKQHRKARKDPEEWEAHKETILREWARKTNVKKSEHVAKYMEKHHNFIAA